MLELVEGTVVLNSAGNLAWELLFQLVCLKKKPNLVSRSSRAVQFSLLEVQTNR